LPTMDEIHDPESWVTRIGQSHVAAG